MQGEQLAQQVLAMRKLANPSWRTIGGTLSQMETLMQQGDALAYSLNSIDAAFQQTFPGSRAYRDYPTDAGSQSGRTLATLRGALDAANRAAQDVPANPPAQARNDQRTDGGRPGPRTGVGVLDPGTIGMYSAEELTLLRQAVAAVTNVQAVYNANQVNGHGPRGSNHSGGAHRDERPRAHLRAPVPAGDTVTRTARSQRGARVGVGLLVLLTLLALAAGTLLGQQPGPGVLDGIASQYQNASRLWRPRLVPIAQQLFMILASIEFAVSGAIWALRRDSLDDLAAKFLLKFALVAFLLALITSFTTWIPPIINGFAAAGEAAIGSSATVSPSGIMDIGRQTALTVLNTLDVGVMLRNPAMAVFGALSAEIIALAYAVIAVELILVLIESYIVLGGGVLFLGFAAFRGTAAFAENLIAYTFGVGIKIFLLYLIVGLGSQIAASWIPLIQSATFFGPSSPLFEILGGALLFVVMAVRIPRSVAHRLSGSANLGIANALRALS